MPAALGSLLLSLLSTKRRGCSSTLRLVARQPAAAQLSTKEAYEASAAATTSGGLDALKTGEISCRRWGGRIWGG